MGRIIYTPGSPVKVKKGKVGKVVSMIRESASGSIASFPDGAEDLPLRDLKVKIEPVQDLHGYDHPWPAGGGVNLIDASTKGLPKTVTTETVVASYAASEQGVWTASGKVTNNADIEGRINIQFRLNNATVASAYSLIPVGATDAVISITKDASDITFDEISIIISGNSSGYSITVSDLQLNQGDAYDEIYPYANVCPISGRTQAAVMRTGKNWCDAVDEKTIVPYDDYSDFTINNGVISITGATLMGFIIPVKPDTQYTASCYKSASDQMQFRIREYSAKPTAYYDSAYIDQPINQGNSSTGPVQITFTTTANTKYILYVIYKGVLATEGITISDIQLELGASATSFEPYQGQTVIIDLGGTVYGGELDAAARLLTITHALETFDGTEQGWTWHGEGSWTQATIALAKSAKYDSANTMHWICNDLTPCTNGNRFAKMGNYASCTGSGANASFSAPGCNTLDKFKTWAGQNNIQFCYELADPFTVDIDDPAQLRTVLGENHIWADTGDVAVEYYADTKLYVDTQIAAAAADLEALILEN